MKNEIVVEHKYVIKTDKPLDQSVVEQYFKTIEQIMRTTMQQHQSEYSTTMFSGTPVLSPYLYGPAGDEEKRVD